MNIPAVGSIWIDNDPRISITRYVIVTSEPNRLGKVQCISWYDVAGGTRDARLVSNNIKRFQASSTGRWSTTGFRPTAAGPVLGYPHGYGYGPDAEPYTGSDA